SIAHGGLFRNILQNLTFHIVFNREFNARLFPRNRHVSFCWGKLRELNCQVFLQIIEFKRLDVKTDYVFQLIAFVGTPLVSITIDNYFPRLFSRNGINTVRTRF
ncbi:MAG: hypothetical protein ACI8WW_002355, partial [Oceanospirillaceae bacterium]